MFQTLIAALFLASTVYADENLIARVDCANKNKQDKIQTSYQYDSGSLRALQASVQRTFKKENVDYTLLAHVSGTEKAKLNTHTDKNGRWVLLTVPATAGESAKVPATVETVYSFVIPSNVQFGTQQLEATFNSVLLRTEQTVPVQTTVAPEESNVYPNTTLVAALKCRAFKTAFVNKTK